MIKRILSTLFVLLAFATIAAAQGVITIRRVTTVPATCDPAGVNGYAVVWKPAGTSPGLYLCDPTTRLFQFQTNTFAGSLTAKTMLYADATGTIVSTGLPTNGQILIGSTGAIPALGTLTSTANETLITNGAASITIGLAATLNHKVGSNFNFTDPTDTTKKFQFVASGITTGTTRTVTVPDANTILPVWSQQATFTGLTASRSFALPDANTTLCGTNVVCSGYGATSLGLNQFASTTSAQFLGVISDESGSGSVLGGTAPTIAGGTHTGITSLGIRSTGSGAFDLTFANTENLTAGRTLTFTVNDAARTVSLAGNLTFAAAFTTSGANALTLTTTAPTNVTLPASGTLMNTTTSITTTQIPAGGSNGQVLSTNGSGTGSYVSTKATMVSSPGASGQTVSAASTVYCSPGMGGSCNATENVRQIPMPYAGTLSRLYVTTTSTQAANGTLIVTVRKNGVAQTVTLTIGAGAGAATFSDTAHSVSFAAGDLLSISAVNGSADTTSATISGIAIEYDTP